MQTSQAAIADSPAGYTGTARAFHWIVALLVFGMIPAGVIMVQEGIARPLQNTLFIFHKNTGVLVLLIVILRLLYRAVRPPPPMHVALPRWQELAAGANHLALYLLLLILPISGYIRVRAGGFPIEVLDSWGIPSFVPRSDALAGVAQNVHYFAGLAMIAVIAAHLGAALYHGLIRRDGVVGRIWPPLGKARAARHPAE